jgi:agmatine/peptidylarginine deiminase
MVRFANDSTILIAWVGEDERDAHPINKLNYDVLSRNYEILKNHRTKNGSHFKVIKVPYPNVRTYDHIIERGFIGPITRKKYGLQDGDTITIAYSSSYLNYVISDKVILLPEYWSKSPTDNEVKEKDDRVRAIFEGLYPDRKIIGINPLLLNSQAGGMHCRYQPQPRLQEI